MRTVPTCFLACALFIGLIAAAVAQPPPPPEQLRGGEAPGLPGVPAPRVPASLDTDKAIAGSPRVSRPELLTWERVYTLALVRDRGGRQKAAEVLNPAELADQAARQGVADFGRFRKDFLASRTGTGGAFRNPSGDYLELLRRLQTIDNRRRTVAVHENLLRLVTELLPGKSGDLTQLDVDLLQAALGRARRGLSEETAHFRDALDDLKVGLGLSPHAAVLPDRRSLLAFQAGFEAVEDWLRNPDRNLAMLHRLVDRLPSLGEVVVGGQPVLGKIEADPDQMEDVLTKAVQLAIQNRAGLDQGQSAGDADVLLEVRVRRRIRHLFETRRAYEEEKRAYELAFRLKDQTFERLVAPNVDVRPPRSPLLAELIEHEARAVKAADRLVALWTSFRAGRLALDRDLGISPYDNGSSFYTDLSAERVSPGPVPPAPADRQEPPPPPVPTPPGQVPPAPAERQQPGSGETTR
jgi:hypothetical protein